MIEADTLFTYFQQVYNIPDNRNSYICIVKCLSFIMALLVLILSVQPSCETFAATTVCCSGDVTPCYETGAETTDHEDGCSSVCNPFEVCGCCAFGVVVPVQLAFITSVRTPEPVAKWGILSVGETDELVSGFWQPPRFA